MSPEKYQYPIEITEENNDALWKRAKELNLSYWKLPIVSLITSIGIFSIFLLWFLIPFIDWLKTIQLTKEQFAYIALGLSALFSAIFAFGFASKWEAIVRKVRIGKYGFPSSEEMIFAECFIMARFLDENEREKALNRVKYFLDYHLSSIPQDVLNEKRRSYRDEVEALVRGKNSFKRMLLFSEESVPCLLRNFGLALVRGDDPLAHIYLKQIIRITKNYGKLEGRFERILSQINRNTVIFGLAGTLVGAIIPYLLNAFG